MSRALSSPISPQSWRRSNPRDSPSASARSTTSPQAAVITVEGREVINLCANNYLGLSHHPRLEAAARTALERWGFGLSSVRFICGTQEIHRQLERALAEFLRVDDAILYSSCFDANGGLFEDPPRGRGRGDQRCAQPRLELIIDGIRLSKAQRLRYANGDLADLERRAGGRQGRALPHDRHRRRVLS